MRIATLLLLATASGVGSGCAAAYYSAMEIIGKEKRDLLVSRVIGAKEQQVEAQEQIQTTFEAFKGMTGFDGGALEDAYNKFSSEYEDSVDAADEVSNRIDGIKRVAGDLFAEWETELGEFSDDEPGRKLRRRSEDMLRETRTQYDGLVRSMNTARDSMDPVLSSFKNQVLSLKHSLNAAALSSLEQDAAEIQNDVDSLIEDMQRSISEA
ncbi:MAG: DUF2959 family protein, partial [Planctomycetota bacterium]